MRDFSRVRSDAIAQVQAGAHVLDINAGLGVANPHEVEPEVMVEAIRIVQEVVDIPLCIDSSVVPALKAGLAAAWGKPIVNSVTGEEDRLEVVLPLVAERGPRSSPSPTTNRASPTILWSGFASPRKSSNAPNPTASPAPCAHRPSGDARRRIPAAGKQLFDIVRMVREELGCNSICGVSNISFGLPNRLAINAHFVSMAIAAGMTCAITDPLELEIMTAIRAADLLMGHDENCAAWLQMQRALATPTTSPTPVSATPATTTTPTATEAASSREPGKRGVRCAVDALTASYIPPCSLTRPVVKSAGRFVFVISPASFASESCVLVSRPTV